jgi:non-heme chloroperoxidase
VDDQSVDPADRSFKPAIHKHILARTSGKKIECRAVDVVADAVPAGVGLARLTVLARSDSLYLENDMNAPYFAGRRDMPAPQTFVTSTGVALDYVEQGDPAGVPLVLLHGYTDSWRSLDPMLRALPKWLRVIALSQRGHGDSDKPQSSYDASVFADDVVDLMDGLGIGHAVVAGHSMGSLVAQRLAATRPQRTLGVVLLGAFRALKGNPDVETMWRDVVAELADPVDPSFVRDFQQSTLAQPVPPAFFEMVVAESLKLPAHVWRTTLRGLLDDDFADDPARIAAPTLILWGDKDVFAVHAEQLALQAAIPGARLITYAGAGHALHWEEPERAAMDVATFARRCSANG